MLSAPANSLQQEMWLFLPVFPIYKTLPPSKGTGGSEFVPPGTSRALHKGSKSTWPGNALRALPLSQPHAHFLSSQAFAGLLFAFLPFFGCNLHR